MTVLAPIASLAASCTLLDTDTLTISTQKLLLDGDNTPDNVTLHQHIAPAGGFCFIDVPAAHLFALDLDDRTIIRVSVLNNGHRYGIVFKHYQHALAYLAKHYGLSLADHCALATTDASPCSSAIVVPAHLSTPSRLTRRPLSTTAFSPFGVMHMAKKQPIRVFLDQEIHSRYLIQAGTNSLTPSALGELLIEYGITQLEHGDKAPLKAPVGDATPAPYGNGA
ncbi:hypothetical protein [Vreelandella venusta]|uniref:Uncharacterized protein n=1 Tax=Vreelandella venusta TaxID=44935 RepID=A0ABX2B839_9GAMM|nr:hypothetical protein [Halomonas venusta]AZM94743.1 hypothetical protein EI420_03155 [Halomonas venusta]NPT29234.1 hypothetical protein [Halomonas venusta]